MSLLEELQAIQKREMNKRSIHNKWIEQPVRIDNQFSDYYDHVANKFREAAVTTPNADRYHCVLHTINRYTDNDLVSDYIIKRLERNRLKVEYYLSYRSSGMVEHNFIILLK